MELANIILLGVEDFSWLVSYLCNMKSMNIQAEKLELMKRILETENPEILHSIKKLLKKERKADF